MKRFLTKKEACQVLKDVEDAGILSPKLEVMLSSIRVCLAADEKDFYFWGNLVEDVRPLFKKCVVPDETSAEEIVDNYEAYLETMEEVCEKLTVKRECESC